MLDKLEQDSEFFVRPAIVSFHVMTRNGHVTSSEHSAAVAKACRIIKSADAAPKLAALAKSVGMSAFHFHSISTKTLGLTPKAYANAHRAQRMRETLPRRGSVTEAIYESGYNSNSRFYEKSSEMLGMRPA